MEQVQNAELLVLVNVKDIETRSQLLLFVITFEREEFLNEGRQCDLRFVKPFRHPEVDHLSEIGFIAANTGGVDHMFDIFAKVLLCQRCYSIALSPFDSICGRDSPESLEGSGHGIVLSLGERFFVVSQGAIIVSSLRQYRCLRGEFVFLANARFGGLQVYTSQVSDKVVNDLRSVTLDNIIHHGQKVIPVQVDLGPFFVKLAMVFFLHGWSADVKVLSRGVLHAGQKTSPDAMTCIA